MSAAPHLLIVDDESTHVKALCRTLSMEGYRTSGFTSPTKALAALRTDAFDLVLTDLMMPDMDGIALIDAARRIDPDLVAVVMTGNGTIDTAVKAMQTGALDYVLKPFNLNMILPVLARALAVRRLQVENRELERRIRERTLELEAANRKLSYFDSMTGLAKRPLFCERLAAKLATLTERPGNPAVAVFDIEQLSTINDSFGRRAGDLLLMRVADRLTSRFEATEDLAHLGAGTFGFVLDVAGGEEAILRRLQDDVAAIASRPFDIEGRQIPVEVKAGFARFPENGADAEALVQNAEGALRAAKASGEKLLHHRHEMSSAVVSRLNLEHRLRAAIERHEFELHYQPKVGVTTRRIVGVEALVRWRDPDVGLVAPGEFLPILESTGMIVPVGEWILRQAALDVQRWRSAGLPPVRVAVNISPVQLRKPTFVEVFLSNTAGWSTADWGLDIEITEGVLVDEMNAVVSKLRALRQQGVQVAIDDFGTGYSSLSRLSELPIDMLKIDRTFTSRLTSDRIGKTLVSIIVELSKAFGMTTVAEGVETDEQLSRLGVLGCDQSQGYLHSKPVRAEDLEVMLAKGRPPYVLPVEAPQTEPQVDAGQRKNGMIGRN